MTWPVPQRRALRVVPVVLAAMIAVQAEAGGQKSRQVTICGIIATPNSDTVDPKLAKIEPQLRKLLPNYGFKLLDVQSKPLRPGQSVACDLQGGGYTAKAVLVDPRDDNGKVQIQCQLLLNNTVVQLETLVTTPPNQLFFCDQALPNGKHLVLGVGAR